MMPGKQADKSPIIAGVKDREVKRLLKSQNHCKFCNEFFDTPFDLAEHYVKEHSDVI